MSAGGVEVGSVATAPLIIASSSVPQQELTQRSCNNAEAAVAEGKESLSGIGTTKGVALFWNGCPNTSRPGIQ